jgi:hypothetical protein
MSIHSSLIWPHLFACSCLFACCLVGLGIVRLLLPGMIPVLISGHRGSEYGHVSFAIYQI